jgi:hypothetical protein
MQDVMCSEPFLVLNDSHSARDFAIAIFDAIAVARFSVHM